MRPGSSPVPVTLRATADGVVAELTHPTLGRLSGRPVGVREIAGRRGILVSVQGGQILVEGTEADLDTLRSAARALRPQHERDWEQVEAARAEWERAEAAAYYDPARIIRARQRYEQALAEWERTHPEAAEARRQEIEAERERRAETARQSAAARWED